jgi:hypothetical protein
MRLGRPHYKMGTTYGVRTGGGVVVVCGLADRVTHDWYLGLQQHIGLNKNNKYVCAPGLKNFKQTS